MSNVKFGLRQLDNPTPSSVSNRIDFICSAFGIISGWAVTAPYISKQFSDIFSSISTMLIIPLLLLTKKYWGIKIEKKKIDIKDVEEIDDKNIS